MAALVVWLTAHSFVVRCGERKKRNSSLLVIGDKHPQKSVFGTINTSQHTMKGFETFFEANKRAFKTKQDVIVATMHFMLVHEYDFVCLGTGETV